MTEIKIMDVKANEIRKGDLLDDVLDGDAVTLGKRVLGHGHMITEIKRGTVKITFDTTGGKVVIPRDATVQVRREVQTEAERAAIALQWAHRQSMQQVEKYRQETFIGDVHAEIDKRAGYVEVFDYSDLGHILQRQAMRKIGLELSRISSHLFETEEITTDARAFEVVATFYAQEVLVDRYVSIDDPLSRSTSTLSNLLNDLDAWARATFIKDCGWMGQPLIDRATEIKTEWDNRKGQ